MYRTSLGKSTVYHIAIEYRDGKTFTLAPVSFQYLIVVCIGPAPMLLYTVGLNSAAS